MKNVPSETRYSSSCFTDNNVVIVKSSSDLFCAKSNSYDNFMEMQYNNLSIQSDLRTYRIMKYCYQYVWLDWYFSITLTCPIFNLF